MKTLRHISAGRWGMRSAFCLAFAASISMSLAFGADSSPGQRAPGGTDTKLEPLGICLEELPYPYDVSFINLSVSGQPVKMAYMDIAAPGATTAAQTVVLLHGKNMGGYYWINTIRKLHDGGYRVVVPDQIGWGKSSKPDIAYSFDQLARNIAQLLDSLKLDKVIVVGHSTGGMLATRFARSYPERVTKLVLEDPVGLEDYRRKIPAQTDEALFDMEAANTNPSQIKKFFANYFSAERKELSDPLADVVIRVTKSGEWLRWAKASALAYRMIYQQPVCYEYDLLQPPTLLVVGEQDHTVVLGSFAAPDVRKTMGNFPQLGKDAVSKMPNGTLVVVPNCGHIPHMEQPEIFHKAVLDFIKK